MRKDTERTRLKIIKKAEKLFASKGIDGVTMAEVNRASGQKNSSAAAYHFGTKEGLLDAILDRHSTRMEQRRQVLLANTDDTDLDQVIDVLVRPLVEKLDDRDGGLEFLRINSQLMTSAQYRKLRERRIRKLPQVQKAQAMLASLLPDMGKQEREARMMCFESLLFQSLLTYLFRGERVQRDIFVDTMIRCARQIFK